MAKLIFDRDYAPDYERPVEVAPLVRRVTARNPGPFTFRGTNSYIVGRGQVAVIDPGPDDADHAAALLTATTGEAISHIFVTHTHRDHSGGTPRLKAATGALIVSGGPHRFARPLAAGETNALDAAADYDLVPDTVVRDGDMVSGDGWKIEAVATPGHTTNHLAFALAGTSLLFSGDHVMAWSTSIVAPPDGSMADYMRSLDRMLARPERRYLPAHGGPIEDAHAYVAALKQHRQEREAAILARIAAGDRTIPAIVAAVYIDLDPALRPAAALSVLAHLEDLAARRLVRTKGLPRLDSDYWLG